MRSYTATTIDPYGAANNPAAARPHAAEHVLLFVALLLILNTFRFLILGSQDTTATDGTSGSALFQLLSLAVYGPGIAILALGMPRWLPRLLLASWPLLALVCLAILSSLWSAEFGATLRRALAFTLTFLFAIYVVSRFEFDVFLRVLFYACAVCIVAGYVAAALPGIGITPPGLHEGSWRGFSGHKNEFGRVIALILSGAVVFWLCGPSRWRTSLFLTGVLALALLYLSHSATAVVAMAGAVAGGLGLRFLFQPRIGRFRVGLDIRLLTAAIAAAAAVALLVIGFTEILELLGRDPTLSGRTKLWAYAFNMGLERPWLGAGYRGFWIDENTSNFSKLFYWDDAVGRDDFSGPGNGHSGYLDLFLELGLAGVALYALLQISALFRLASALRRYASGEGLALATVFSFLLVYSLTERVILQQTEGVWFLFMAFYLYAGRRLITGEASSSSAVLLRSGDIPIASPTANQRL